MERCGLALTCRWSKQNNIESFDVELLLVPLVLNPQVDAQEGWLISCNPVHKCQQPSSVPF